jgi:hypothetical protein
MRPYSAAKPDVLACHDEVDTTHGAAQHTMPYLLQYTAHRFVVTVVL